MHILRGEFTPGTCWDEGSQSYVPDCQVESRFASQFNGENTVFKLWQVTFVMHDVHFDRGTHHMLGWRKRIATLVLNHLLVLSYPV